MKMPVLIDVKSLQGFHLALQYDDGTRGTVDLSDLAGHGVFAAWLTPGAFERVRLGSHGAVEWDGEIDLCPDALYLRLTGKRPEEVFEAIMRTTAGA